MAALPVVLLSFSLSFSKLLQAIAFVVVVVVVVAVADFALMRSLLISHELLLFISNWVALEIGLLGFMITGERLSSSRYYD